MLESLIVAIYSPFPRYSGGRENWLFNVARRLGERGVKVTVVAYDSDREPFHELGGAGVELVVLPSIRRRDRAFASINRLTLGLAANIDMLLLFPLRLGRALAKMPRGPVLCMNAVPEGLGALVSRRPFLVSVRGDLPAELSARVPLFRPLFESLERAVLRRAVAVLANGDDTRDRLQRGGVTSTVLINGVDFTASSTVESGDEVTRRVEQFRSGRTLISSVGTIRPIKGLDVAIDTAHELNKRGSEFVLAFAGKGDPTPFRRRAEDLGLAQNVIFAGETRRVGALLQATDIYLATSGGSGLAMATLEAMAAGLAIVAIDTPVYRQLLCDGETGLLAQDAPGLAAACARLMGDPGLRRSLGEAAREAAKRYDWEAVIDSLLNHLPDE